MPKGPGTYGSKMGRPPKKKKARKRSNGTEAAASSEGQGDWPA